MKKFLIILLIFILTIKGFAQYGKINGHIYDTEKKRTWHMQTLKSLELKSERIPIQMVILKLIA